MAARLGNESVRIKDKGKNITLTEEEEDEIVLENEKSAEVSVRSFFSLAGKLLTKKQINVDALRRTFNSIWRLNKGFGLKQWPNNIFVFQFYSLHDKEKVVKGSPWSFDNQLMILKDVDADESPTEMVFDRVAFWVRIFNVSFGRMTKEMAEIVGRKIGNLIEVDEEQLDGWSRYLRVRVDIDIDKPLKRGVMVRDTMNQRRWLSLQFERLGSFCYVCGKLGHRDLDCEQYEPGTDKTEYQYGEKMRASPLKSISKTQKMEKEKEDLLIKEIRRKLHFYEGNIKNDKPNDIETESGTETSGCNHEQRQKRNTPSTDQEEQVQESSTNGLTTILAEPVTNLSLHDSREKTCPHEIADVIGEAQTTQEQLISPAQRINAKKSGKIGKHKWKKAARNKLHNRSLEIISMGKRKGYNGNEDGVAEMDIDEGSATKKQKDCDDRETLPLSADSDGNRVRRNQ